MKPLETKEVFYDDIKTNDINDNLLILSLTEEPLKPIITTLPKKTVSEIIDYSNNRQQENNNILKNDKLKYLTLFFKKEKKPFYKIIFVKWINHKKNIALVYFPDYSLEILITLFVSIEIYSNKIYKVKYIINDSNLLEFIY